MDRLHRQQAAARQRRDHKMRFHNAHPIGTRVTIFDGEPGPRDPVSTVLDVFQVPRRHWKDAGDRYWYDVEDWTGVSNRKRRGPKMLGRRRFSGALVERADMAEVS